MSLPPHKQEDDDKASLLSADLHDSVTEEAFDSIISTPKLEGYRKPEFETNGFLSAPRSAPTRPLSPDTLSILSVDELVQLHSSRRSSTTQRPHAPLTPPRGWRAKLSAFYVHNKGLLQVLLAQIFGTLMNVTTRILEIEGRNGEGMHPYHILFARMIITLGLSSGYMWYRKTPHFPLGIPEVRWLLVARGFGGFFGVFGMYYSLLYLPMADAVVITFLAPPITNWVCSYLLKHPFTRIERIGTIVSLVGVIFIARPTTLFAAFGSDAISAGATGDMVAGGNSTTPVAPADASDYDHVTAAQQLSAVAVALLGVAGTVTAFTTIRSIGERAHPLISVNYFAGWCTAVSTFMLFVLPDVGFVLPVDLKDWALLIFLGVCGFVMQFLLAAGLSYEKSSRATNMTYTQMLFSLSFDKLIFGHTPGVMSILGSTIILGSAVAVAVQKDPAGKKEDTECSGMAADEEAQRGLLGGADLETGEDHDRLSVEEVQLRTFR